MMRNNDDDDDDDNTTMVFKRTKESEMLNWDLDTQCKGFSRGRIFVLLP